MYSLLRSHNPVFACLLDGIFPLRCIYCTKYINTNRAFKDQNSKNPFLIGLSNREYLEDRIFCKDCLSRIYISKVCHLTSLCSCCGSPIPVHRTCPCVSKFQTYESRIRFRSYFNYSEEIRTLIFLIKFNPSIDLCNWSALLLYSNLCELFKDKSAPSKLSWDSIAYVPSRLSNIKKRGGYSTFLICKRLASLLGGLPIITFQNNTLNRQSSLKIHQRIERKLDYQLVPTTSTKATKNSTLLIDDMLTTGSSSHQLALRLLDFGIKRVDILTLARSIDFRKNFLKYLEASKD